MIKNPLVWFSKEKETKKQPQKLSKEIVINASEFETRIALLEEGRMMELMVERADRERIAGNLYKAKVNSILPGMQAAFLDIGLEKSAFLHVSDLAWHYGSQADEELEDLEEEAPAPERHRHRESIEEILKKGDEVLIQVVKEQIGTKGPRVTTELALAGRFIVLIPGGRAVRVSKRISNWAEKRRLKDLVLKHLPSGFGVIIRTEGEEKDEKEFCADLKSLVHLWNKISRLSRRVKAPALLYKESCSTTSVIRDLFTSDIDRLVCDSRDEYRKIIRYLKEVAPHLRSKVLLYAEPVPVFDLYGIEPEIDKMLERKIWLKRGVYLVIDQTEALVTIDVNTGRFVGKDNQEQTIFRANMEAAKEIGRQIRLRDIGGLIIVDFIDMPSREHRRRLFEEFRSVMRSDRSKYAISPISEFGLIEMTRERIRPSLIFTFSDPCPACNGFGRILSKETLATKIERWFKRARAGSAARSFKLIIHPYLAEAVADGAGNRIARLSRNLKLDIDVIRDTFTPPDRFRVLEADSKKEVTELFMK